MGASSTVFNYIICKFTNNNFTVLYRMLKERRNKSRALDENNYIIISTCTKPPVGENLSPSGGFNQSTRSSV